MLACFICSLQPIMSQEVLKENPQSFEEACVLDERFSCLAHLVGGGSICGKFQQLDLLDCPPIELNSMGAQEPHH